MTRSTRFALVLYNYFPHGGGQRDAVRLARELKRRGNDAAIYAHKLSGERPDDVEVIQVPVTSRAHFRRNAEYHDLLRARFAEAPETFVLTLVRAPIGHHYFVTDPCFRDRLADQRPMWLARLNPRDRFFLRCEQETMEDPARRFSFLAPGHLTRYQKHYALDEQRCTVLPPEVRAECKRGADAEAVRRETRAALNVRPDEFVCVAVGSGFHTKGLDRSVRCIAALRQQVRATLLVAGADSAARYQRLAERLGVSDHVQFLGGRDDVPQLLLAADVMLHPARFEAGGKVLIEAMASGLPVVTTEACGYAALVAEAQAGCVLREPFEQAQLNAQALRFTQPATRQTAADAAVAATSALSDDAMIRALADSLEEHAACLNL